MTVKNTSRISPLLTLIVLLSNLAVAQTQDGKVMRQSDRASAEAADRADTNASRKAESADRVEQLQTKVEQLQALIEQQQRALAEMQKSIEALTSKTPVLTPASAHASVADGQTLAPPVAAESAQTSKGAGSTSSAQKASNGEKNGLIAGWDKSHAVLRSSDGRFETSIAGYAQFDHRGYQSGNHPANTFLIRRARLGIEGRLERYFDFKLEGDFSDITSTILRDFFINIHRIDEVQLRFGHFKEPFSQDELRTDSWLDFVEPALVNNLVPSRSPGLMASGVINKGVFEYQVGAFNGKGQLVSNNNATPEGVVRLRFAPWKHGQGFLTKGFIFGGAFAEGRNTGGLSVRGLTESRSFIFYTPEIINGRVMRANGELTWMLGPATIRAEYDQTNQSRDNLGLGGTNLPGVVGKGYMAAATYLLTRETKPENGPVAPRRSLFDDENGKAGSGAWELKFRYANLQIANGTAKSNRAETFYFGPNWYMNRFMKYNLDLGFERYKDPLRSPNPGDKNFFVVLNRIQFAF
jgi:phosphate-selective porin OprO/OprP